MTIYDELNRENGEEVVKAYYSLLTCNACGWKAHNLGQMVSHTIERCKYRWGGNDISKERRTGR